MLMKKKHAKRQKSNLTPREQRLKRQYNLQPGDYEKIFEWQNGKCYICKKPPKEGKRLHIDHNHKTGLIRGLLTWDCNTALGKFKDDFDRVAAAYDYLMTVPATQALGREVFGRTGRITNKRKRRKRSKK